MSRKPDQIAEAIQTSGINKTHQDSNRLLILGFLAGAYVGFGAQIATTVAIDAAQYVGIGIIGFALSG